jgi:hypothetical protein
LIFLVVFSPYYAVFCIVREIIFSRNQSIFIFLDTNKWNQVPKKSIQLKGKSTQYRTVNPIPFTCNFRAHSRVGI